VTLEIILRHALRHLERHFCMRFINLNEDRRQIANIQFVKRIQNDVQDDAMRDAKI